MGGVAEVHWLPDLGSVDPRPPGHGLLLGDARAEQVDPELASHRRAAPNTTGLDR